MITAAGQAGNVRTSNQACQMRLVGAAIFAGLALVAGAIVYDSDTRDTPDPYSDAVSITSAWANAVGLRTEFIRQVSGPWVYVKFASAPYLADCVLFDISTQYENEEAGPDHFWVAGPAQGEKSRNC
jgi:hypothetical protein